MNFAAGYCRICGVANLAREDGTCSDHHDDRSKTMCAGVGQALAPSQQIFFYRATWPMDDYASWIVVARGEEHAREVLGDYMNEMRLDDVGDEFASLTPGLVLAGTVMTMYDGTRLWAVGTLALEIRR